MLSISEQFVIRTAGKMLSIREQFVIRTQIIGNSAQIIYKIPKINKRSIYTNAIIELFDRNNGIYSDPFNLFTLLGIRRDKIV